MSGELHALSVAIGRLQEGQERLGETIREIREASTEEHRKVHDIVVATSESVRNLAKDVAEMKPLTKDYEMKRAEARGARRFIHALYVTFGGLAGAVGSKLMDYFAMKPPHP